MSADPNDTPENAVTYAPAWNIVLQMHALQTAGEEDSTPAMQILAAKLAEVTPRMEYDDHLYTLSQKMDELYKARPAPTGTQWAVATVIDQTWGYHTGDDTKVETTVHKDAHLYAAEEDASVKAIELALKFDAPYFIWEVHNVPEFRLRPDTW